jgi:hypothetical protein
MHAIRLSEPSISFHRGKGLIFWRDDTCMHGNSLVEIALLCHTTVDGDLSIIETNSAYIESPHGDVEGAVDEAENLHAKSISCR